MQARHLLIVWMTFVGTNFVRTQSVPGQTTPRVSDNVARAHLLTHDEPVYPAAARATPIHGTVILDVTIDASGKVVSETVIDGPAELRAAAVKAVKGWVYKPFTEGGGKAVKTYVSLPFGVEKTPVEVATTAEEELARKVYRVDAVCLSSLKARSESAVKDCREEVDLAETFPDQSFRFLNTMAAHRNLGRALLHRARRMRLRFNLRWKTRWRNAGCMRAT